MSENDNPAGPNKPDEPSDPKAASGRHGYETDVEAEAFEANMRRRVMGRTTGIGYFDPVQVPLSVEDLADATLVVITSVLEALQSLARDYERLNNRPLPMTQEKIAEAASAAAELVDLIERSRHGK